MIAAVLAVLIVAVPAASANDGDGNSLPGDETTIKKDDHADALLERTVTFEVVGGLVPGADADVSDALPHSETVERDDPDANCVEWYTPPSDPAADYSYSAYCVKCMYLKWADQRGFKVSVESAHEGNEAGLSSAEVIIL